MGGKNVTVLWMGNNRSPVRSNVKIPLRTKKAPIGNESPSLLLLGIFCFTFFMLPPMYPNNGTTEQQQGDWYFRWETIRKHCDRSVANRNSWDAWPGDTTQEWGW